ncbi:MAG TPA: response regulator transcription factor [Bacteroidia bacterium]|nr:response regulator transcription factor [Bacteroidia bacterium]HNT79841.1 response regulator transcription factor [Bacteroidia bacterium]
MNIALVEDNPVNRNSFIQKMEPIEDVEISFISNSGIEFLEKIKKSPVAYFPQVVFMDIQMEELNGIETVSIAKALYPEIHFIMFTVFEDDDNIFDAIQAGASGYLLKHESASAIHLSIKEVLEYGGAPLSPAIARKTLQLLNRNSQNNSSKPNLSIDLLVSDREKEILLHMVNGYDAKRIAELSNISVLTVRKHIANIYTKLHVNSKAQVISLAHKNKWVQSN